jgi:hypothetical protein
MEPCVVITFGPAIEALLAEAEEARRLEADRGWGAMMLALRLDVCRSILAGRPVMVRCLDPEALRRALRGDPPPPTEFIRISLEMLDALNESGALCDEGRRAARRTQRRSRGSDPQLRPSAPPPEDATRG